MSRSKTEMMQLLTDPGVVAVIRAQSREQVLPVAEALVAGGLKALEVTLTTPDAIAAISELSRKLGEHTLVGVGTVLNPEQCRAALNAGARFVVTPICRPELTAITHAAGGIIIMGAYTATEAQLAHESGADFIKLFPADSLGVPYIKALRAPLPHLRIIPTGGVDQNNIGDFFRAGCPAVGVGSSLITKEILAKSDWAALTAWTAEFIRRAKSAQTV